MSEPGLFLSSDDRRWWDDHLTVLLAEAGQHVAQGCVTPTIDLEAFRSALRTFDFAQHVPLGDLLTWTIAQMECGVVHTNHPRYLGLFNPAPTFPAQCADRIAAMFNPQLATATTSPAAVEIEAHVVRAVAQRAGLGPHAGGHFTSGGSEANYTEFSGEFPESVNLGRFVLGGWFAGWHGWNIGAGVGPGKTSDLAFAALDLRS